VRKSKVYVALLHYPVYNKKMEVITTSITNLDIHDIARVARTYDVDGFFLVHPLTTQRELAGQILDYWQQGYGGEYNPDRKEAFRIVRLASSLEEVLETITRETGQEPKTVATDARVYPNTVGYGALRNEMAAQTGTYVVLFGTGWGLARELMMQTDFILEPIAAGSSYNHLSVRSAVAIILDRLLGDR